MNGKEMQARNIVVMVTSEPVTKPSDQKSGADLLNLLSSGLLVMRLQWLYNTQDWVTCILGDDIDNDGDIEILLGSRDGHLCVLTREGTVRWDVVLRADRPSKRWITSLAIIPWDRETQSPESRLEEPSSLSSSKRIQDNLEPRILVLTYSGDIQAFDQDGTLLNDWHLQRESCTGELAKCSSITHMCLYNGQLLDDQKDQKGPMLIIGTNDQRIHLFDSVTGERRKTEKLRGNIERICVVHANNDKQPKIFVTTSNKFIQVLDQDLKELENIQLPYKSKILVATNPFAPVASTNKLSVETMTEQPYSSYQSAIYSSYNGRDLLCWAQGQTETYVPFQQDWPVPITFAGQPTVLAIVDHNDVSRPEMLVGCTDHFLYILDHKGRLLWKQDLGYAILSIYAHDYGDDDLIEVVVSLSNNTVRALKLNLQTRKELNLPHPQEEELSLYEQIYASWNECKMSNPQRIEELRRYNDHLYTFAVELGLLKETPEKLAKLEYRQAIYQKDMHNYKKALSILSRLREQRFHYYWTNPPDNLGHIQAIVVGDIQNNPVDEVIGGNDEGELFAFDISHSEEEQEFGDEESSKPREYWIPRPKFGSSIIALQTWKESTYSRIVTLALLEDGTIRLVNNNGHIQPLPEGYLEPGDAVGTIYVLNVTPPLSMPSDAKDDIEQIEHVILGLKNKKIYVYEKLFSRRRATIETPYNIDVLCAYDIVPGAQHVDIIVADSSHTVRLYRQSDQEDSYEKEAWNYPIDARIHCLAAADIDHDGQVEILVGSEDRHLYALNQDGQLKWRYFLPDAVLCVAAHDLNKDGNMKVLAGGADGYIYIFDGQGDLSGQIATQGRVNALVVKDMHPQKPPYQDDLVEIVAATDNRLVLIQILNIVAIEKTIDECWRMRRDPNNEQALLRRYANEATEPDEYIRAFALRRLAGTGPHALEDFNLLRHAVATDTSPVVARALAHAVVNMYWVSNNPEKAHEKDRQEARQLLQRLSQRPQLETRIEIISLLDELAKDDEILSFQYLRGFLQNADLRLRRMVVRKLSKLTGSQDIYRKLPEQQFDLIVRFPERVFDLLIIAANDLDPWIREEAGRGLARYFDIHRERFYRAHPEKFLKDLHNLTGRSIDPAVIKQIASSTREPAIKKFFCAFSTFLTNISPTEKDTLDTSFDKLELPAFVEKFRIQKQLYESELALFIDELDFIKSALSFLDDLQVIYEVLQNLLAFRNIDDIEQFIRVPSEEDFMAFPHFFYIHTYLKELLGIVKQVNRYRKREAFNDKAAALLEAISSLSLIRRQYIDRRQGEQRSEQLIRPEDVLLRAVLQHWYILLRKELHYIRGQARLSTELIETIVESGKRVQIFFHLMNDGRCAADDVHVTLIANKDIEIIGNDHCFIEEISTLNRKNEHIISFTLKIVPNLEHYGVMLLIAYKDAEGTHSQHYDHTVVLQKNYQEWKHIPNPYHGGTPIINDSSMLKGREDDLERLYEILSGSEVSVSRVVLLIGQRRLGKTSLINQLVKRLQPHVAVAIDLQSLSDSKTSSMLFLSIAQAIQKVLQKRGFVPPNINENSFTANPNEELYTYLSQVVECLGKLRLVLLMDEFEMVNQLIEQDRLDKNFLHYLRSFMQQSLGINFLLAGAPHVWVESSDNYSAFFNIAQQHTLTRLKREDAEKLIVEPIAPFLVYDPLARERMFDLTGGQPLLIHLLSEKVIHFCNRLHKRYANSNEVNMVVDKVVEGADNYFTTLWQKATSRIEYLLLLLMAQDYEQGNKHFALSDFKEKFLYRQQSYEQSEVLQALRHLVQEDLIEEDETRHLYTLPIGLFSAWLRKKKSIDSLID